MTDGISIREFEESAGLEDWRLVGDGAGAFFRTDSFGTSARLVAAIAAIPRIEDHPPTADIRSDGVHVRLLTATREWYGPGRRDVEMARAISAAARSLGLRTDPSAVMSLLIVPGAPDITAVIPFWQAVLGYVPRPDSPAEDLVDPANRGTPFWFEEMDEPRSDGGGSIHVAVWLPYELAEARVAAALAAGGRLVRDRSPMWWTLADAAGNEVDVSTAKGRD
jgi:4a-hydroxytetrahydrobiopterin dehydratase